jgi:hypothetical protein
MKSQFRIAIALAAASVAGLSWAEDTYVGASIGARTHYGLDCASGATCDRNGGTSGKIVFGKTFDNGFGGEVMAFRLGQAKGSVKNGTGLVPGRLSTQGLAAVGTYDLLKGESFTLKGRLGLAYAHGKASYEAGGSSSKSYFTSVVGLGTSYAINKQWSLNADWDRTNAVAGNSQKSHVDLFSIGATFHF